MSFDLDWGAISNALTSLIQQIGLVLQKVFDALTIVPPPN